MCDKTVSDLCKEYYYKGWGRVVGEVDELVEEQLIKEESGLKFDEEKLRYDLIPPEALEALARVLTYGAKKYADRNWEKGMKWGRVFGAAMRHLWAFWRGEDNDPETGFPHLHHALCCVAFLVTYDGQHLGLDDRPRRAVKNAKHYAGTYHVHETSGLQGYYQASGAMPPVLDGVGSTARASEGDAVKCASSIKTSR